ncbi:SMI1/KNR4 family protein [Streptomyces sp. NPDC054887]
MTTTDDRRFPAGLAAAMAVPFLYDEDGVGFEPFANFLPADETTDWIRAWTGNGELTGDDFRVFGQDGTGGYAAFWLIRPDWILTDQPVVFLGSEGETAVVARDLDDFLWLLAGGYGPLEATPSFATTYEPDWTARPNTRVTAIAERFAPNRRRSAADVIGLAAREFPDFDSTMMALCR